MTPDLDPNSDAKILQIFLQPYFANPQNYHFQIPEVLPLSVIPFWKPLITPDLDLTLFPHHEVILTFIQE